MAADKHILDWGLTVENGYGIIDPEDGDIVQDVFSTSLRDITGCPYLRREYKSMGCKPCKVTCEMQDGEIIGLYLGHDALEGE